MTETIQASQFAMRAIPMHKGSERLHHILQLLFMIGLLLLSFYMAA